MPIRALHVAGYRSVRDVRLALSRVNVLVGPNGCGKTNLYRALYLLGINHLRFSVKFQGLDARLSGVEPCRVVKEILA